MAAESPSVSTGFEVHELEFLRPPPAHVRAFRSVVTFSRRKPLGAFGAVLLLIPVFASFLLPGLDLGVVQLPQVLKYSAEDYKLGTGVLEGPSAEHWMGTDVRGRDLFARLLVGTRMSFIIGGSIFAISIVMSTTIVLFSAYYVRTVDLVAQRMVEVFAFLPDLILLVALFSVFGADPLTFILTVGVLRGVDTSRILRSLVIQVRSLPFIEAAKSIGATNNRIILRHVFPQVFFLIILQVTSGIAIALLIEAGLSVLGFGITGNTPTLGNLLNGSRQYLRTAPWLAIAPGVVLFMILLGARLLGDALRDVLDPRLRGSR